MENRKLKIGIDLDDTIWSLFSLFLVFYNKKHNKNHSIEEIYKYDLSEMFGISKKETENLFEEFYKTKASHRLNLYPGVLDFFEKIRGKSEIFFITARKINYKFFTEKLLLSYFDFSFSVHYIKDKDNNDLKTKGEVAKELHLDFFIDDHYNHTLSCAQNGIFSFLFTKPWNKEIEIESPLIERFSDWIELIKLFEKKNVF